MKNYDGAIAYFLANKPMAKDVALPEDMKLIILSLQNPVNLPFTRDYGLTPRALAKLDDPTIVVLGKKDIQVNWKIGGRELEKATAKKPPYLLSIKNR